MDEGNTFQVKDKRWSASGAPEEAGKNGPAPQAPRDGADKERENKSPSPPITFSTFVLSLSTSAAMHLGGYQDPVSGLIPRNLELAKQTIDILGIIREKTAGNLNADESELLESALYELRMRYIDETKKGS